jgi:membrane protein DedA with SNARE-associated domain
MTIDSFTALFATHQEAILQYRYAILLLVALFEGTGTMIATGAMIATGFFNPFYALVACTIAEIIDGFIWYTVGYYFGATPIEYFIRNSPARQAFMAAIRRHSDKSAGLVVLLVKMTYSVTNATLILIGSLKYDLKRFAVFNIIGSIGWATMLLSLGYVFGQAALA